MISWQNSLIWHGICSLSLSLSLSLSYIRSPTHNGNFTGQLCPKGRAALLLKDNSAQNAGLAARKGTVRSPKAVVSSLNTPTPGSRSIAPANALEITLFRPEFSRFRAYHKEAAFSLDDLRLEVYATAYWQTPRFQDGPYCPIVSRVIA
jgi:hypothetical protein